MIRELNGGSRVFVLDTEHTTYAFRILPTGQAEHLYYGARIPVENADDLIPLYEKREFEIGNSIKYHDAETALNLEDICLEASGAGHGDLREPTVEIVCADGCRTTDFVFRDAVIDTTDNSLSELPSAYSDGGGIEHLRVTLADGFCHTELELHYCVFPECDVITRRTAVRNSGENAVKLTRVMSMQLDISDGEWDVTSFHGAWAREMDRSTSRVQAGQKTVIQSTCGVTSSRANPFFMLHDPNADETSGDCYGFNLIYSGEHFESIEKTPYGKLRVASGISPTGFEYTLASGETFESPEAALTFSPHGFTGQSRNMHAFVRRHIVRGEWRDKERPTLINSWEACYFKISESKLVSLAKAGRDLGIELFVMDDGWFGERSDETSSLGDWTPNKKKLPHGLSGLAKKITDLGMMFGVWVEPEMLNVNSDLYREHPEWAVEVPNKPHSEGRCQRFLDLANPAVQDHVIEKMSEVFSSADISYVKWDMNRVMSDAFSQYLPPEKQGEFKYRYTAGLYRVMRSLTERFPHILFEGCASGGNRFDLGILCFFPQIWASDDTDALERTHIQEGYSYGYPQSVVSAHVSGSPNHQTLRHTPLETRFNVAAFGLLGYEFELADLSSDEKKEIARQVETYKKWREVLQFGDFYRIESGNIHQWICVSRDRTRAVGMIMQELNAPNTQYMRFTARGLDPDRRYRFYSEPVEVNVKVFGSLVNTMAPIHVKQDSLIHNAIAKFVKMNGDSEDVTSTGGVLMHGGVKLSPAFAGTGFNEKVRIFRDFDSRMYFIEEVK